MIPEFRYGDTVVWSGPTSENLGFFIGTVVDDRRYPPGVSSRKISIPVAISLWDHPHVIEMVDACELQLYVLDFELMVDWVCLLTEGEQSA